MASENSSDETVSYSEAEVERLEAESALNAILDENESLEQQHSVPDDREIPPSGKQKVSKRSKPAKESAFWQVLAEIQTDIKALKRNREPEGEENSKKRLKVTINTADHQCSSKDTGVSQLSSVETSKQLRSAQTKQLSSASHDTQLSSEKKKQLSSAPIPHANPANDDNTVAIDADESDEDPLVREQHAIQQNNLMNNLTLLDQNAANDVSDDSSEEEEDDGNFFEAMVDAIDIRGDEDIPGGALVQTWAEKINLAWTTKVSKTALNNLLKKYRTPSNLTDMKIPKMNKEIWRLIDKWQKKADITLAQSQRCLIKAATAALNLHDNLATLPRATRQVAMQTTADIVSLLGKVNREIISKRKTMTRPNLKGDFKYLSSSTNTTENLFGDNLTQDIKDIQVKRKIENPYSNYRQSQYGNTRRGQFRGGYRGGYNNQGSNYNTGNFLWRGRSRGRFNRASHHHSQNHHAHGKKQG